MRLIGSIFPSLCLLVVVFARQEIFQTPWNRSPLLSPEIDAFISGLLDEWHSPGGIAVAVVRKTAEGGWDVETKGYGAAKADGTQVTDRTLFPIASNSKLFTALSAGLLIANHSLDVPLSWGTKIATLIPEWDLMDPVASSGATIVDLMSHRTGLPRHDFAFSNDDTDVLDMIKRLQYLKPSAEFRETWQYNNLMFAVLAHLPPTLVHSRPKFAEYVKANIFDPLGMNSTTYAFTVANRTGDLADGFARQQTNSTHSPFDAGIPRALPFWAQMDEHMHLGPGGVITNARDLVTWLQTLLLYGRNPHNNASVLPSEAIKMVSHGITVQRSSEPRIPDNAPVVYGGGQTQTSYRGHTIIGHDGSVPGFKSMIYRLPFDGIGVALLSNDEDLGNYMNLAIRHKIIDRLLGLPPLDSKKIVADMVLRNAASTPSSIHRHPNATLPSIRMEELAGVYADRAYGQIELCLIATSNTASLSCRDLLSDLPTVLPGAVDATVPTLLGRYRCEGEVCTYARLGHFDGNLFNLTLLQSFPTGNASEPFWTVSLDSPFTVAEFGPEDGRRGFSATGIWGAGPGVPQPSGKTLKDRAEVWFSRQ